MKENIIKNKDFNYLTFTTLDKNNVINLFTLKPYNFRKNIVDEEFIKNNYLKLQNDINYSFNKIIKPYQNHTNRVEIVNDESINKEFLDTDGLITNLNNVALITSVADCQAILLYDSKKKVIGNIHSGWKGTLNRIIENAIKIMINEYKCNPSDIEAYICPSILKCCFEVDEDVRNQFLNNFKDVNIENLINIGEIKLGKQKYYIDTVEINKRVMINLGLNINNIIESNICTKCNNHEFHSHRKEGLNSGRNIALICLR